MRIAIIDVGTNTTRLFIADVVDGAVLDVTVRVSRVTRLGAGVDASGRLAEDAMAREAVVLEDYAAEITAAGADRAVAVMTSAVRDAANGAEFAAAVAARHRIETDILSGEAEALLTYRGATDEVPPASAERILVIDIGGGSTELVLGHGARADFHVSTQAGVVRQADRHITGEEPTRAELDALAADVAATLAAGVPEIHRHGVERALAVAGTPTSLAAIDQELETYDGSRTHGYRLSRATVDRLGARLGAMTIAERRHLPGLSADRAGVIVPGVVILQAVMDLFDLPAVEVCEHDILRGAALHYAQGAPRERR